MGIFYVKSQNDCRQKYFYIFQYDEKRQNDGTRGTWDWIGRHVASIGTFYAWNNFGK